MTKINLKNHMMDILGSKGKKMSFGKKTICVGKIRLMFLITSILIGLIGVFCSSLQVLAANLDIAKSNLVILTEKEGIASALAHRHIIAASNWTGVLELKKQTDKVAGSIPTLESGSANIVIRTKDLVVDSPEAAAGIISLLGETKRWDPNKDKLEPGNADSVRENMLAESQLDAQHFPKIEGFGRFSDCKKNGELKLKCSLESTLKVRDRSVVRQMTVSIKNADKELVVEFIGEFRFSEFGIRPYKAMLGAIAVTDEFILAGKIVASE